MVIFTDNSGNIISFVRGHNNDLPSKDKAESNHAGDIEMYFASDDTDMEGVTNVSEITVETEEERQAAILAAQEGGA